MCGAAYYDERLRQIQRAQNVRTLGLEPSQILAAQQHVPPIGDGSEGIGNLDKVVSRLISRLQSIMYPILLAFCGDLELHGLESGIFPYIHTYIHTSIPRN